MKARTSRTLASLGAVALGLALVTGCGGSVASSSGPTGNNEIETVDVTGTGYLEETTEGTWSGTSMPIASRVPSSIETGNLSRVTMMSSDDRVTFTGEVALERCEFTFDEAEGRTVGQCTATTTVTNEGGGWEGTDTGTTSWTTTEPEHMHVFDFDYVGTGGYEGLRYFGITTFGDGAVTQTGQIVPMEQTP